MEYPHFTVGDTTIRPQEPEISNALVKSEAGFPTQSDDRNAPVLPLRGYCFHLIAASLCDPCQEQIWSFCPQPGLLQPAPTLLSGLR